VCAYLFNEGGGLKLYDSVRRKNQTATATGTPTWTSSPLGKAIRCDTAGQLFTGGTNPLNNASAFTVAAWINISDTSFQDTIFAQSYDNAVGDGFYLRMDGASGAKITFEKRRGYILGAATANATATTNTWTHAVGTVSAAGTVTLYINGIPQTTTATSTGPITNNNTTTINGGTHTGSRINQQAALMFWNRGLSAREVKQLYADSFAMFRRELVPVIIHPAAGSGGSVASASGTCTVTSVGQSTAATAGSAAGTCTVAGIGAASSASLGSAAGTCTVVGVSLSGSVASASGTCTVLATGQSAANAAGSAAGTSTVSGIGTSEASSVGAASGACTVLATGRSASASVGSAAGTSTVTSVGRSSAASSGSAAGTSTVTSVGQSTAAGVYSAAGTCTVLGVSPGESVASASGTSTASAVGASAVAAIFSAVGTCTVVGISPSASFSQADPAGFFTMGDGVSSISGGDRSSTVSVSSGFSFFGV
jgi:hypothetical protein